MTRTQRNRPVAGSNGTVLTDYQQHAVSADTSLAAADNGRDAVRQAAAYLAVLLDRTRYPCRRCGRALRDPRSIIRELGPTCYARWSR